MKRLILTEKPSVAKDFAKALNISCRGDGFFEGEDTIITWAIGHLMELKSPDEYNSIWKKWSFENLPILPDRLNYKVNSKTKKQLQVVLKQLKRKDLEIIIVATDAGREGELIGRTLLNQVNSKANCFRFWTSQALSTAVIHENLDNLRPLKDYDRLYYAGRARQSADWLVGMNLSRLATLSLKDVFSVGRVQTAVLSLLVMRSEEIKNFKSTPYFTLKAHFIYDSKNFTGLWFRMGRSTHSFNTTNTTNTNNATNTNQNVTRIESKKKLDEIIASCDGQKAIVKSVDKIAKKIPPPQLFSLTELQKTANRIYGFSANETLKIAQALYERHKCLSYPRTDAKVLGTKSFVDICKLVEQFKKSNLKYFTQFDSLKLNVNNKSIFNDQMLTDHHALIPLKINNSNLNNNEMKIFTLVVKRFIGVFLKDYQYLETKIIININQQLFKSIGQEIQNLGWKSLYSNQKRTPINSNILDLPNLNNNDEVRVKSLKPEEKKTLPPNEYNEATLLQDMVNPSRLVEEEKFKKAFRGEIGLGTQATRAQIIETLLSRKYIERVEKNLLTLEKGRVLIKNLKMMSISQILTCPQETAKWELELETIAKGEGNPKTFMINIRNFVSNCTKEWKGSSKIISFTPALKTNSNFNLSENKKLAIANCPLCDGNILETAKSFSCSNWKMGCKLTVWKKIAGKKISKTQAKKMIKTGKSDLLKGFKSKAGKNFDAILALKEEKVTFEFLN